MEHYLSIDIGGSKLLVGIVDQNGEVLCKNRVELDSTQQENIVFEIRKAVEELDYKSYNLLAGGVSIPGLADPDAGRWLVSNCSDIESIPIAKLLEEQYQIPFYVENDGNICAFGEKVFGKAKDISDYIWITISNGVGSGIFLQNQLFRGADGNAGELGHIIVVDEGRLCDCGKKGCLEAYSCGRGIVKGYQALTGKTYSNAKEIAHLAKQGDSHAKQVFYEAGFYIGKVIAASANLMNMKHYFLGGGVSLSFPLLEDGIQSGLRKGLYQKGNPEIRVETTGLGYEASLIGAAAYGKSRFEKSENMKSKNVNR